MPSEFEQYFRRSSARWRKGTTVTLAQIRALYGKAARDTAAEIRRRLPTAPSAQHLSFLQGALEDLQRGLTRDVLAATLSGINIATVAGTDGARLYARALLAGAFDIRGIDAIYHAINQRAILAFATRTRGDGLMLSDRIWRAGEAWRGQMTRTIESGLARGLSARDLARDVEEFMRPGVGRPSSIAVRRRLHVPRDVSYQSLRVARTEMSMAFKEGTALGHSRTPSYLGSMWELSAAHPFVDDCDDLASGGPRGDGFYPAGDEPLQPHPNCMCTLSPVHEDLNQFASRLERWIDDPSSDPALQTWYQEVAAPVFAGQPIEIPAKPVEVTVKGGALRTSGIRKARSR